MEIKAIKRQLVMCGLVERRTIDPPVFFRGRRSPLLRWSGSEGDHCSSLSAYESSWRCVQHRLLGIIVQGASGGGGLFIYLIPSHRPVPVYTIWIRTSHINIHRLLGTRTTYLHLALRFEDSQPRTINHSNKNQDTVDRKPLAICPLRLLRMGIPGSYNTEVIVSVIEHPTRSSATRDIVLVGGHCAVQRHLNRKLVCYFLLVNNTNLPYILYRIWYATSN